MAAALDKWLKKLWPRELPVLARTVDELTLLAPNAENLSAQKIAAVILHDPMMTLNVLQLANSRQSSRFGAEITTVEHAVMMLGVTPFFNHYNKLERLEAQYKPQDMNLQGALRVISRSHHAACHAWDWAVLRKDLKAEEVYIAALLADMGELLLWLASPETMLQLGKLERQGTLVEEDAQREVLGGSLHELTLALAPAWHVPEFLAGLIDRNNSANPRALTANLAVLLAHHSQVGWHNTLLLVDYEAMATLMHMTFDEVASEIHQTSVRAARRWEWFHVRPAAAWLPMLQGDWPAEMSQEIMAAPVKAEGMGIEADGACLMPRQEKFEQTMQEVAAHLDGSLDLHDMMSLVLAGMHQGIALNRVMFALLSGDRSKLKAKYMLGVEPDSPLRNFELDMRGMHLFARLMEKVQGVWYRDSNRATLEPLISNELRQQIGEGEFFAMSIFAHGQAVGLIYADRKHGTCGLDEHSYNEFKQLSLRAAEGLAHLSKKPS